VASNAATYHTRQGGWIFGPGLCAGAKSRDQGPHDDAWGLTAGRDRLLSSWHRPGSRSPPDVSSHTSKGVETHTRNPLLLLRLCGLFLLRLAQRTLFQLLFQEPPRSYRPVPTARQQMLP